MTAESATFQNARLWDYRPLGATLDQIQTVRQYYDFTDVDTDRYMIDGQARQVLLSARELAQEKADASCWVNQRLTYTHGIGLAMVPVNEVTPEGLPRLLIRDLPPVSEPARPRSPSPGSTSASGPAATSSSARASPSSTIRPTARRPAAGPTRARRPAGPGRPASASTRR